MHQRLLATVSVMGAVIVLSGCSLLNSGPTRDTDGRVTESAKISAQDLKNGDCFTFNSADGGVVDEVTVMPCTKNHEYVVIGQGKLTPAVVSSAGSLQNAVSAACSAPFDTFKAGVKSTTRPKQEFLAYPASDSKNANQLYSCISTDPDQGAAGSTPTS